jgi:hypothetical protein
MANLLPKNLYIGNDTASNVYTVSNTAGSYSIVRNINICNVTATAATCDIHLLGSAGTPGNNNAILKTFAVAANETISYDAGIVLDVGQKIHVVNASNKCTFTISGVEYSA